MKQLNVGRVLSGGLAAGVVMNVVDGVVNGGILASQYQQIMRNVHAEHLIGPSTGFWIGMDFVYAMAMSFLGAAMRPMYGPGVGAYLRAGAAVWAVAYLSSGWDIIVGVLPLSFHAVGTVAAIVSFSAGAFVASRLYREPDGA